MASNNKTDWKVWCFLVFILTLVRFSIATGDYYLYESDDFTDNGQHTLRLLNKRQATDLLDSKKLSTKPQLGSNPENSSNPKTGSQAIMTSDDTTNSTAVQNVTTTPTPTTTVVPALNDSLIPTVDYDGNNITVTNVTQDYHKYYNSSTYTSSQGMQFWIDFDSPRVNSSTHDMLSQSHRRAATVSLSFDFPFYGHWVRNITIATGGFLYTGDYVHSWLAATQYIAPLMANFDTSMTNYSTIKYMDNGTAFSVQWDKVSLQDRPDAGNFSFQATLLKTGDIIFAYKSIPMAVTTIGDDAHPVKVGVSDAYIIDRTIFFVRRKTIYEYHKVDKKTEEVASGAAIYFTALPTCVSFNSCESCITNTIHFECVWCSTADRCSDGMDRFRQDWLVKGCDKFFIDHSANCSIPPLSSTPASAAASSSSTESISTLAPSKFPSTPTTSTPSTSKSWDDFDPSAIRVTNVTTTTSLLTTAIPIAVSEARANAKDSYEDDNKSSNVSSVVGILFLIAIVVGLSGWLFYAYRNPHTPSGQCFIRYRPSQWRWRSGEAHYTAAAIHM